MVKEGYSAGKVIGEGSSGDWKGMMKSQKRSLNISERIKRK